MLRVGLKNRNGAKTDATQRLRRATTASKIQPRQFSETRSTPRIKRRIVRRTNGRRIIPCNIELIKCQPNFIRRSFSSPPPSPSSISMPRFEERLKMMMRHHAKYTIANSKLRLFTLVSPAMKEEGCGGGARGGGWQRHCAKWPRRRV